MLQLYALGRQRPVVGVGAVAAEGDHVAGPERRAVGRRQDRRRRRAADRDRDRRRLRGVRPVRDRQPRRVRALLLVGVARVGRRRGLPVAERPAVAQRLPLRIARARTREPHRKRRRARARTGRRRRDRRLVDRGAARGLEGDQVRHPAGCCSGSSSRRRSPRSRRAGPACDCRSSSNASCTRSPPAVTVDEDAPALNSRSLARVVATVPLFIAALVPVATLCASSGSTLSTPEYSCT